MRLFIPRLSVVAIAVFGCAVAQAADDLAYWNRVIQWASTGNTNAVIVDGSKASGYTAVGVVDPVVYRPSGASVVADVKTPLPLGDTGKKVAAVASVPVTRAGFVRGVGLVARTAGGPVALVANAAQVLDWLAQGGVTLNNGSDPDKPFLIQQRDFVYTCDVSTNYPSSNGLPVIGSSSSVGCGGAGSGTVYLDFKPAASGSGGTCTVANTCHASVKYKNWSTTRNVQIGWTPASMDDIVEYMDRPEAPALTPNIVQEGISAGIDPFGAQYPKPTLAGPSSVPGSQKVTTTQVRVQSGTTTEVGSGYTGDTQPATKTTTTTTTYNTTYNENRVTYNTTTVTTTTITNNVTNESNNNTDSTETVDDDAPESATDTPLPAVPKLYERKYPDGMVGIWNQKQQQLKDTSVGQLVTQLMPNVGDGGCPKWQIPLDVGIADYGVFDASIPCQYWAVIRIVLIVGSLFLARAIIFGG